MSEPREQRLYDIGDSVKYLHSFGATAATTTFVRSLINSGQVPHIRIGRKFYITKTALDGWLVKAERRARP